MCSLNACPSGRPLQTHRLLYQEGDTTVAELQCATAWQHTALCAEEERVRPWMRLRRGRAMQHPERSPKPYAKGCVV